MPLVFRKVFVADQRFEAAGVFDVNNDGIVDIVSGAFWYEGPDFKRAHHIGGVTAHDEYFDDFSTIPLDVNGDGRMDFITGGWWGNTIRWRENPVEMDQEWPTHIIAECGNVETTRAWDIDGDGVIEIVPNTPGHALVVYKLVLGAGGKGAGKFTSHVIYDQPQGHGLGWGDISGSGLGDFVISKGWLEAPRDLYGGDWILHEDFDLGMASVPVLAVDVNGDGLSDLIVGNAHNYGLYWLEQRRDANRKRTWVRHEIDADCSQYHDMQWVDIDGDGHCELVTGQRYRAHCGRDPGESGPIGSYYFKWNGEGFTKQVIDYGPARVGKGLGIHFATADLTGNGLPDIVAPGKDGLYIFYNEGFK